MSTIRERRATDTPETIKQAVKNALDDKRMDDIASQLNGLANQMSAGFAAIDARQVQANGKLNAHELEIQNLKTLSTGSTKYTNVMWFVITTLVGIVSYFISNS